MRGDFALIIDYENEVLISEAVSDSQMERFLAKNEKEFTALKTQFKQEIQDKVNLNNTYNKMVKGISEIPDERAVEIIRRTIEVAGLAAASKASYLYSAMTRCINSSVQRLVSARTASSKCVGLLQRAVDKYSAQLLKVNDPLIKRGVTSMLMAFKAGVKKLEVSININISEANYSEGIDCDDEYAIAEAVDNFLLTAYDAGILSENFELLTERGPGAISTVVRNTTSAVSSAAKGSRDAIDGTADRIVEQKRKADLMKARNEVMNGRKPLSSYVKMAVAFIAIDAGVLPGIAIVPIIMSMKRNKKIREIEKSNLIAELTTELEIINEKIKDAEADNNRVMKYNYIRLRRELQRGISQLRIGDKFGIGRPPIKL